MSDETISVPDVPREEGASAESAADAGTMTSGIEGSEAPPLPEVDEDVDAASLSVEPGDILQDALAAAGYDRTGTRAIIHIGLPKTGTTSIQHFMMRNSDRLRENGIAFIPPKYHPDSLVELPIAAHYFSGHFHLPGQEGVNYGVETPEQQAERMRTLLANVVDGMSGDGVKTAILSSEHIQPWVQTTHHIRALDELMGHFFETRHFICYARDPLGWVLSLYSQALKNGERVDLTSFLARIAQGNTTAENLCVWRDVIGRERLDVGLMDRERLKDGDMVSDFFHRLGLDVSDWERPEEENPSLTLPGALAMEALNVQFAASNDRAGTRRLLRDAIIGRTRDGQRLGLPPGNWTDLLGWADAFRRTLQQAFFPDEPHAFFKSAKFVTANEAMLAQQRASRVLANVMVERAKAAARFRAELKSQTADADASATETETVKDETAPPGPETEQVANIPPKSDEGA